MITNVQNALKCKFIFFKLQMLKNVCKTYKIVKKYFKKIKMFKNVCKTYKIVLKYFKKLKM